MEDRITMMEQQRINRRKKQKRAKRIRAIFTSLLIIIILILATVAFYYYYKYSKEIIEKENAYLKVKESEEAYDNLKQELVDGGYITREASEEIAKEAVALAEDDIRNQVRGYMENGDGTLTMLENLFPENIVVPDIGKYRFFDVDNNLKLSELDFSKFVYPVKNEETSEYEGEVSYEDESIAVRKGVDVSKFQGKVNWKKVKNDGIDFAYIRLGYRGYESGKIVLDDTYEDNIKGCNEVGLDCGVYFFTEAKTEAEGREEAEFVLENLEEYHTELPIVIDVEESANTKKTRTKNLTPEERTKIIIAFCEKIKDAGYTPMIYGNLKSLMLMTEIDKLDEYDRWFAYYHYPLRFPYKFKIWQYTSSGIVDGIDTEADINLMFY